ncbi:MAG: hypothetical protein KGZ71_13270 [Desulfobulbaceae bacterium]|nr:hypothetical protein [Candidatus Kapabacteria bacterium]MBS4001441.1 hypothetical protein [Desulfobulbaceae bacterium]
MSYNRKKRVIEIYFVLYLAALILLIPQSKKEEESGKHITDNRIFQLPFNLKAEKNALNTLLTFDSTGMKIVSADTINTIYFTGNVKNVKFEFEIEDQSINRKINLMDEKSGNTRYFRVSEDLKNQNAKFFWHPVMNELKNNTFIVNVEATAVSNDPETFGAVVKDNIRFILNYQVVYDFEGAAVALEMANASASRVDTVVISPSGENPTLISANVVLTPTDDIVRSIAYTKWRNEIFVFGLDLNRDLRRQPIIELSHTPDKSNKGTAKIVGFTNNTIVVEGDTPEFGSIKVKLNIVRHADGKELSREFRVIAELLDDPIYSETMYPDVKFTIEPNLPMLSNRESVTKLINSEGRAVHVSENNMPFTFTPNSDDINKEYVIERFVNDKSVGKKYKILVKDFPEPEIHRIARFEKNKVRVFTNSYGLHQGAENYIKNIEITEGNAVAREIIGAQNISKDKQIVTKQVFEIVPRDDSKPFSFKIRAIAQNNKKSKIVSYPEN